MFKVIRNFFGDNSDEFQGSLLRSGSSVTTLHKTAMICYRYAFEVSPTLKNICSYLFDKEGIEVDVYLDQLYREPHFKMQGVNIIEVLTCGFLSLYVRKFSEHTRRKLYVWYVRRRIRGYERIIAADFDALALIDEMGVDLSRVVYVSLESTDLINHYPHELARRLLGSCSLNIIQSRERAEDLTGNLGLSLPFEYLPVSSRPSICKRNPDDGKLKIIYSGYITDWACLTEFIEAIRDSSLSEKVTLTIQGHAVGTEEYLEKLIVMVSGMPNVKVDTGYYDEVQYMKMLSDHDIGLAFYKNLNGSSNFENLALSSGKISNYLWSGMAVMTNIDAKETHSLPFIYMEPSEAGIDKLCSVLDSFRVNRDEYISASFDLARAHYDFDAHMNSIHKKMPNYK